MVKILRTIESILFFATVFFVPLAVLPISPNPYVVPKIGLLVLGTSLILILKALRHLGGEKIEFRSGSFDLPLVIFALITLYSTFSAPALNKMEALLLPGTGTVILCSILLYFITNQLDPGKKRLLPHVLILSASTSAVINILTATGIFSNLPFLPSFVKSVSFSFEGSFLSTAIYLVTLLPLGILIIAGTANRIEKILFAIATGIMVINLSIAIYYLLPGQPYQPKFPDIKTSWTVAIEVFKTNPFSGIGPGNYVTAFDRFRPLTFNQNSLWTVKFGTAFNFYLTILTEIGAIGGLALLLLLVRVYKGFTTKSMFSTNQKAWFESLPQLSLLIILVALALFPATLTLIMLLCLLLSQVGQLKTGQDGQDQSGFSTFLSLTKIPKTASFILLILIPIFLYRGARAAYAEFVFNRALKSISGNDAKASYDLMRESIGLNPLVDRYHLSLSQLNLALANSIAKKDNVSDQERTTITQLIQQAILEGKAAVAVNRLRAGNWENLARVYQSVIPLAKGADVFAIQSYQQAVAMDPYNPNLRIALGGLLVATKNYDQAVRTLELAVMTKPDHPNARYNLAFALKEKGDIEGAITQMKQVLSLIQPASQDYELVKKELENLEKNRPVQTNQTSSNLTPPPPVEEKLKPPIELGVDSEPPAVESSLPEPSLSPSPRATDSASPTATPVN